MTRPCISSCMIIASLSLFLGVTSCKTTDVPVAGTAVESLTGGHDALEDRLSTAAATAAAQGKTEEALALYEKLYTNPGAVPVAFMHYRNQDVALNYAQLLRKTGDAARAAEVLSPLSEDRRGKIKEGTDPIILNEFAAANIDLGNFEKAEDLLNLVLANKNARKFHADSYNLIGVSLDARGEHKEAEEAFRQALTLWKGDQSSVLNNLAVCLASQGLFDESIATLRQALLMSQHKEEVAHNIELITELRKSVLKKKTLPVKAPSKTK